MAGDFMPFFTMVVVQLGYAGMNIISKLAMDSGMDPFIHVAYRQIFATLALAPLAYFMERKTRPKMTSRVFFNIFLCSISGVTVNQLTYFIGLKNSTPTIACALSNIIPALTFLLAVPLGQEKIGLKSKSGQAKVWGTVICVSGAVLVSFYHGPLVRIGQSSIHWKYADKAMSPGTTASHQHGIVNIILGPTMLLLSAASWAVWLIIQTKISEEYKAPYSSSAIMCLMGSFECTIAAFCFNHHASAWLLTPTIRLVSSIYSGIVCSALAFCLMSWSVEKKGPLYVSVFTPLLLVIVAFLSWVLLREKLYVGTVGGSVMIVLGLYSVLWGKKKELMRAEQEVGDEKPINQNSSTIITHTLNDLESNRHPKSSSLNALYVQV